MEEENNPIKTVGENAEINQNESQNQEEKVYQAEVVNQYTNTENTQKINNSFALASFICSMVGLLIFGIPCGVAAIVTGILGLVKFDSEKEKNKWMAIVGLVVGIFDFIIVAIYNVMRTSSSLL